MKFIHFENIRMGLLRKLDWSRMFAIWRIDSPWQAVTKKVIFIFTKMYCSCLTFEYYDRVKGSEWEVAKAVLIIILLLLGLEELL